MKKLICLCCVLGAMLTAQGKDKYDNPDTLVVARDGTGQFRNVSEAIEVCRAFMEYHKVIYIKKGTYKEKLIIPQWLTNIELCGEDRDQTIITWDDHANIFLPSIGKGMGTFRTYTLKIEGCRITLKNITIENNAARLGQAVALHTEGDCLTFVNCRFLGHQDTIYTGRHACSSRTAIPREPPTSSSAPLRYGSSIATSSARPTHTSRQPPRRRMYHTATSSTTAASRQTRRLTKSIWDVRGATMAIRYS